MRRRSRRRATVRLAGFEPRARRYVAARDLVPAGVVIALAVIGPWIL